MISSTRLRTASEPRARRKAACIGSEKGRARPAIGHSSATSIAPSMATEFRAMVSALAAGLTDDLQRDGARQALRGLVDRSSSRPEPMVYYRYAVTWERC